MDSQLILSSDNQSLPVKLSSVVSEPTATSQSSQMAMNGSSDGATVTHISDSLAKSTLSQANENALKSVEASESTHVFSSEDSAKLAAFTGLQIYLPCANASGLVPVETASVLFCLLSAGVPLNWIHLVVCSDPPIDFLPGVRVNLPSAAIDESTLPAAVVNCRLPAAHLPEQRLCVAGVCAVVRRAVRTIDRVIRPDAGHYYQRDTGLLGFRRGTLAPPADASVWTHYVERDVPISLRHLLKTIEAGGTSVGNVENGNIHRNVTAEERVNVDSVQAESLSNGDSSRPALVPPELLKFDYHMQQPLRVHNVWRQEQKAGGQQRQWTSGDHKTTLNCVHHTYAEGHVFTINDLLLYPCFRIMTEALIPHGLSMSEVIPTTLEWMKAVEARPGVKALWTQLMEPLLLPKSPRLLTLTLPEVVPESLYKRDPARYQPKKRVFTIQNNVEASLSRVADSGFQSLVAVHPGSGKLQLDWDSLPSAASPADGGLPASRLQRKLQQLENLVWFAVRVARTGDTIVDFCSGGGHVGILLAVLLPKCHVVLVENKEESLKRGQERVDTLQLTNISLYQCNMEFFMGRFQMGVALHACGVATDIVLERCLAERAAVVCCPCCYGAVHQFGNISYPRSRAGRSTGATLRDWLVLGHAADQTHADGSQKSEQGRRCMALVDSDRAAYLAEAGYQTVLTVAEPPDCSNKNHLLVAVPPQWREDGSFLRE